MFLLDAGAGGTIGSTYVNQRLGTTNVSEGLEAGIATDLLARSFTGAFRFDVDTSKFQRRTFGQLL